MPDHNLTVNRAVVFVSAVVYWAGVFIQARRVRRRIGRSPNVRPRGTKERILWLGWVLVVLAWLAVPLVAGTAASSRWVRIIGPLVSPGGFFAGLLLVVGGYAGTLWCYSAMGTAWRMGVDRTETNPLVKNGPYAKVRHPIYAFQIMLLMGMVLLIPVPLAILALGVHLGCVAVKAADEENYLDRVHGNIYRDYVSRTGRFLPKLGLKSRP